MAHRKERAGRQLDGIIRCRGEIGVACGIAIYFHKPAEILAAFERGFFHDVEAVFVTTVGFPAFEMRQHAVRPAAVGNKLDHVVLDRAPAAAVTFDGEGGSAVDIDDMRILQPVAHLHLIEGLVRDKVGTYLRRGGLAR